MNKRYLFILLLLAGISTSFKSASDSNWTGIFDNEQITIKVSENRCVNTSQGTDNVYLFLKITNKTDKKIQVSYLRQLWYNEKCFSCDHVDEYTSTVTLEPNATVEGDCEMKDKSLKIFKSMPSGFSKNVLTNYELKNIVVTTIN